MFSLTNNELEYLEDRGCLGTDREGRPILIGLSFEDTAFYMTYLRHRSLQRRNEAAEHYSWLHRLHEQARRASSEAGLASESGRVRRSD